MAHAIYVLFTDFEWQNDSEVCHSITVRTTFE